MFGHTFSATLTKTEAIAVNVIPSYIFNELLADLKSVNYVTVTIDSTTRKNFKLTSVVRYFTPNEGVTVKLLHFDELHGETSDILVDHVMKTMKKYSIACKLICFCANNTNTNFGGAQRRGEENVFRKVQKSLDRAIFGIGGPAHILHNAI